MYTPVELYTDYRNCGQLEKYVQSMATIVEPQQIQEKVVEKVVLEEEEDNEDGILDDMTRFF